MAIIKKGYAVIDTRACTVTVTRSDADPVYWHAEPVRPGDGPNRINIVGEALEKQDLYWRQEIGKNLVQFLDKSIKNWAYYKLAAWPEHYKFVAHYRGNVKKPRMDSYLYGSPYPKGDAFRSTIEFGPHIEWIVAGMPMDPESGKSLCNCTHCQGAGDAKKKQRSGVGSRPPRAMLMDEQEEEMQDGQDKVDKI